MGASLEQRATYQCSQKDKESIQRGLNNFKTIYIKSIIDEDTNLRIKALRGIITCSKKLGIDHSEYTKELYVLLGKQTTPKSFRESPSKKLKGHTSRNSSPHLNKVLLRKGFIEFYFNTRVPNIKKRVWFDKKDKLYKIVLEIPAKLSVRYTNYRLRTIQSMKLVQTRKSIQILFIHSKPFAIQTKIQRNKLIVYLQKRGQESSLRKNTKQKKVQVTFNNRKNKIIVIDAGHGGKDSGAIGYKRKKEKDIVLQIAKKVYAKLKNAGYKVYLTRRGDYFVTLRNRTRFANRVNANLFISIHANAAPTKSKYLMMRGLETFFLSPARSERAKRIAELENKVDMKNLNYYSKNVYLDFINREKTILSNKLAIDIQRNVLYTLRKRYNVVDGGVRPGPFWVLVGAQMPAILIEVGYITNPTEAKRISNPYYQNLIAEGILNGIESYFRHNER